MKHIGLFAGIGGFELAAKWMGWETIAWCEWNKYCQQILKQHFPEAEGFGDITKTDFRKYANLIDILTGGFPCQPYSAAGKRLGKEDDRHLWPEMLRAVREIQPGYVVGENVSGLTNWNGGMVFDEVQADLENEGYEVLPFLLPACAVNAPHRRDRIWFMAYSFAAWERRNQWQKENETDVIPNTKIQRERSGASEQGENGKSWKQLEGAEQGGHGNDNGEGGIITNPGNEQLQRGMHPDGREQAERYIGTFNAPGYERNTWDNFPTQSPLCGRNDGVPNRVDRIKALGNAIVPQVALQIFKAIEQFNKQ